MILVALDELDTTGPTANGFFSPIYQTLGMFLNLVFISFLEIALQEILEFLMPGHKYGCSTFNEFWL